MKKLVQDAGLSERVFVDSAGTAGWHEGNPADPRMRKHGAKRGYRFDMPRVIKFCEKECSKSSAFGYRQAGIAYDPN